MQDAGETERRRPIRRRQTKILSVLVAGLVACSTFGRPSTAQPSGAESARGAQSPTGADLESEGVSLLKQADSLFKHGKFADAELLYKRGLAMREQALGPDHANVALTLFAMADMYMVQERFEDAKPLLKRTLKILEKDYRPDDIGYRLVIITRHMLATIYVRQGNYAEAEPLLERALADRAKVVSDVNRDDAQYFEDMAGIYQHLGKYDKAEALFDSALKLRETRSMGTPFDVVRILNEMADLYRVWGHNDDADRTKMRADAIKLPEKRVEQPVLDIPPSAALCDWLYTPFNRCWSMRRAEKSGGAKDNNKICTKMMKDYGNIILDDIKRGKTVPYIAIGSKSVRQARAILSETQVSCYIG